MIRKPDYREIDKIPIIDQGVAFGARFIENDWLKFVEFDGYVME